MAVTPQDVHVGDIGTVYSYPVYDNDLTPANFNPTSATTKRLTFRMPGATGLCVRDAEVAQKSIAGVDVWCLQYTVVAADVAAWESTSVGGFHQAPGEIAIQGYLEFSANQKWTGSAVTRDYNNRLLRVVAALTA
jgi:hypothetical protein